MNAFEKQFLFQYVENGNEITITKHLSTNAMVTVPDSIAGLLVTRIEDYAFANCKTLHKVTLPESLVAIGDSAFSACWMLEEINFPKSLKHIGEKAFWNCASLSTVDISQDDISIGLRGFAGCVALSSEDCYIAVKGILFQYFWTEESILPIGEEVHSVDRDALKECPNFSHFVYPNGRFLYINDTIYQGQTLCTGVEPS